MENEEKLMTPLEIKQKCFQREERWFLRGSNVLEGTTFCVFASCVIMTAFQAGKSVRSDETREGT